MLAIINIPWLHKGKNGQTFANPLFAALDIIGSGNPALAQAIHDSNNPPPFSAHLKNGLLRLGCLNYDVITAVAESNWSHKATLVAHTDFNRLLEDAPVHFGRIPLRILTPVSLGKHQAHTALPDPHWFFGSLLKRWRMYGGPELPDLQLDSTSLSHANLRIVTVELGRYHARGCVGSLTYVLRGDLSDDARRAYHALACFAEYAGAGRKTSHGLGRVERDPRFSKEEMA